MIKIDHIRLTLRLPATGPEKPFRSGAECLYVSYEETFFTIRITCIINALFLQGRLG